MADKKKNREEKKIAPGRGSKKRTILIIVLLVILTPFLRYAMLIFILGMLPAFVASYVDTSQERNLSKVVFACNMAGLLPILARLWQRGITSDNVWIMMQDPTSWLVFYSAAAFGWLLIWFFPQMVHFILKIVQDSNVSTLKHRQQTIIDEWGMSVDAASRKALRNALFKEDQKKDSAESKME